MFALWTPALGWLLQSTVAASVLMLLALGLCRLTRQPARRQRLCELALGAALLAAVAGLAPAWLVVNLPLASGEAEPLPAMAALPEPMPELLLTLLPAPAESGPVAKPGMPALESPPLVLAELPVAPPPSGPSLLTALGWSLVVLYGLGMAYFMVRWLGGHLFLRRLLRHTEPAPAEVVELFARLPGRRRTRLLLSRRLRVPISLGVLRPTVIVPAEFCAPAQRAKLAWVFAHELTHVERRDALSCLLLAVGQTIFFHLPWFWKLRRQVRLCQEYVADAVASAQRPADEYAEFLLSLTETKALPLGATGVAGPVSDLFRRVTMLLQNPLPVEKRCPRLWTWGIASVLLALAIVLGGVGLRAEAGDTIIIIIPGQKAPEAKPEKPKVAIVTPNGPIIIEKWVTVQPWTPAPEGKAKDADNAVQLKKILDEVEFLWRQQLDAGKIDVDRLGRLRERLNQLRKGVAPPKAETPKPAPAVKPTKEGQVEFDFFVPASNSNPKVDLKKLEKLLEKLQADPSKADPKEIQKALEELRKSQPTIVGLDFLLKPNQGRVGIRLGLVSADVRDHLNLAKDQGVVIEEVFPDTPAAKAGLKAKDILLKINAQAVSSNADLALKAFEGIKDESNIEVTVIRRGKEEVIKGLKLVRTLTTIYATLRNDSYGLPAPIAEPIPEKGALITLARAGDLFTIKHREKNLTITVKGTVKDGKSFAEETVIEIGGKIAAKVQGDMAIVPEEYRARVQQLLNLSALDVGASKQAK